MISRLVLVRHAKAVPASSALDDALRTLSEDGRRACSAHYRRILGSLLPDKALRIWSSPAVRALQTAEIVAKVLNADEVEEHDCLYDSDVTTLSEELACASGTVVLVGHDPFISDFHSNMSGSRQHFSKGAVSSFSIVPSAAAQEADNPALSQMKPKLEFFVQGPNYSRWEALIQIEDALQGASERLSRAASDLLDNPDDCEALHQYRISIRIVRSLVLFLGKWLKKGYSERLSEACKSLQGPTSRVREMDMLLPCLEDGSIQSMLCTKERYIARASFIEGFRRRRTRKLVNRVCEMLRRPAWKGKVEALGLGRAELAEELVRMQREQELAFDVLDFSDREAVHSVRKGAKALRYVSRDLASVLPGSSKGLKSGMAEVQQRLGELCDAWVNEELLVKICGKSAICLVERLRERADGIVSALQADKEGRRSEIEDNGLNTDSSLGFA